MRKPTFKQAKRWALLTYRAALKAAEEGDWKRSRDLVSSSPCQFCLAANQIDPAYAGTCRQLCPAWNPCRKRRANANPSLVVWGDRTPAAGLAHFRKTIEQLEALEV